MKFTKQLVSLLLMLCLPVVAYSETPDYDQIISYLAKGVMGTTKVKKMSRDEYNKLMANLPNHLDTLISHLGQLSRYSESEQTLTDDQLEKLCLALGLYIAEAHKLYYTVVSYPEIAWQKDGEIIFIARNGFHPFQYSELIAKKMENLRASSASIAPLIQKEHPKFKEICFTLLKSNPSIWKHHTAFAHYGHFIQDLRALPLAVLYTLADERDLKPLMLILNQHYKSINNAKLYDSIEAFEIEQVKFFNKFVNSKKYLKGEKTDWEQFLESTVDGIHIKTWKKQFWNYSGYVSQVEQPYSHHTDYYTTFITSGDYLGVYIVKLMKMILKQTDVGPSYYEFNLLNLAQLVADNRPCYTTEHILGLLKLHANSATIPGLYKMANKFISKKYTFYGEYVAEILTGMYTRGLKDNFENKQALSTAKKTFLEILIQLKTIARSSTMREEIKTAKKVIQSFSLLKKND